MITGNSLPVVTLVIPARNEEGNIEECLRGISEQDYPKDLYEIIVADGHSIDRTREIAGSLEYNTSHIIRCKHIYASGMVGFWKVLLTTCR